MWILLVIPALVALYLFLISPAWKHNAVIDAIGRQDLAHRGLYDNEAGIPENSLAAFQRAIDHGFGMEMDVQLTADGQLVVFHDAPTLRMTGVEGRIRDLTLAEIRELRLLGTDELIPTFGEFLALVHGQVPLCIEIKCDGNNGAALSERVFEELDRYEGPYYVESFDPRALWWVRRHRPLVGRGQLALPAEQPKFIDFAAGQLLMNFASRPHFIAYDCRSSRRQLAPILCRKLFRAVAVEWTVLDEARIRENRALGITSIFEGFIPEKED